MQNSDFWTRIANLYGSQISPAVLFLQCSVSSIRITSLHGSQPSCVVFGCNRATFGQEKQVSIIPALTCSFCMQNSEFWTRITNLYGSQTSPVILCMQYGGISTWITCLYGSQPSSLVLCMQNSDFRTRLTSLYGSQTSSVVLSTPNSMLSTRINRL